MRKKNFWKQFPDIWQNVLQGTIAVEEKYVDVMEAILTQGYIELLRKEI
ncbi:MAG: hypothetical protein LLG42_14075 [Chloroflexi bacterium]|nr:hypothetical protein [Chloroflexota bacterium]